MDFNPRNWKSTKMIRGYTYSMRYDSDFTLMRLKGVSCRIVERKFFHQPSTWNEDRVWGWIKFKDPIPLWDAMEAGLVPRFRMVVMK